MGCCCGRATLKADDVASGKDLSGKVFIVTGATSGIGFETAHSLWSHGGKVIFLGRDDAKTKEWASKIHTDEKTKDRLVPMICDLSSFASIRTFVTNFKALGIPLHCLINNAGVLSTTYKTTKEGWELAFGTSHLGHFLLTTLLIDELIKTKGRVVSVSSKLHEGKQLNLTDKREAKNYNANYSYQQSKLANIHFTKALHKHYSAQGVTATCLHPGVIATELIRDYGGCVQCCFATCGACCLKTPQQGAATTVFCAVDDSVTTANGGSYYVDSEIHNEVVSEEAKDGSVADSLWDLSVKAVADAK